MLVNESPPGIRVNAKFNNTKEGQRAKHLVHTQDIKFLSIWANELKESKKNTKFGMVTAVENGTIREASLVLTGMNPGAVIDDVVRHSDDPLDPDNEWYDGVIIHTEHPINLYEEEEEEEEQEEPLSHEDEEEKEEEESETLRDIVKTLNKDQERLFDLVIHSAATGEKLPPTKASSEDGSGPTVKETFDTLSDKQKNVLYYIAGQMFSRNQRQT